MGRTAVALSEIVELAAVEGDRSWRLAGRGYRADPKCFLERYVKLVLGKKIIAEGHQGKRPGKVIFMVGRVFDGYDLFGLLDETLDAAPDGPYVIYGILVLNGYNFSIYKWERHPDGYVTRQCADKVWRFNKDDEIRDWIGPAVRGAVLDVGLEEGGFKVLVAGVDCKSTDMMEIRNKPNWYDYPMLRLA